MVGDRPTEDLVRVDEPLAARQWLDPDIADPVLAVPAGLLDVPSETLRFAPHRCSIRNLERYLRDLDRELVLEPVKDHVEMGVAHAPQDRLVGLVVALEPQCRVLLDEALQTRSSACPRRPWSWAR